MEDIIVECIKDVFNCFSIGKTYKVVWDENGCYYNRQSFVTIDDKNEKHVIAEYSLNDEWFLEHFKIISNEYFKHYKGAIYKVLHYANHTENNGELVIYSDEKGNVWARPAEMFFGFVDLPNGSKIERFSKI